MADEEQSATPAQHEAARLRGPVRLLVAGPLVAFALAALTGLLGADGRAGFVLFMLLLAATFAATGVWVGGALLVDEFRGEPTSRRRGLLAVGMFVAALVCMTAVGGIAGVEGGS